MADGAAVSAVVSSVLGLGGVLALDWVMVAVLWRLKKGTFEISRDDANVFAARTDLGRLSVSRSTCILRELSGTSTEILVDEVERVDLSWREAPALWQEWLRGFDLTDMFRRYRDTVEWYEVALIAPGQRVPVFAVGQYVPREFLSAWYFELQARVLASLGLFQDARERAVEVQERVQDALREHGWRSRVADVPRRPTSASS